MMIIDKIKNNKGQALTEFAICLPLFLLFVFGLFGASMWGTAGFLAHEIAHESARKYAVTLDKEKAENLGKTYLGRWAYIFIEPNKTSVNVEHIGTTAQSEVVVKPRLQKLYIFTMPEIKRTSTATLEDVFRNPNKYSKN